MSDTLVQKAQYMVGAEDDDFFSPDSILTHLNNAQETIVAKLAKLEKQAGLRMDSLNHLRTITAPTIDSVVANRNGFEVGTLEISPSDDPISILNVVRVRNSVETPCREMTGIIMKAISRGRAKATDFEIFYTIINSGDTKKFHLYGKDLDVTDSIETTFIKKPSAIVANTEVMVELPLAFEYALLLHTAANMALQEEELEKHKAFMTSFNTEFASIAQ